MLPKAQCLAVLPWEGGQLRKFLHLFYSKLISAPFRQCVGFLCQASWTSTNSLSTMPQYPLSRSQRVRSWAGSPTSLALQPDQGPISFELTIGCYNANVTPLFILYIGTLCLLFLDQLNVNGISDIFKEPAFGFIGFSLLFSYLYFIDFYFYIYFLFFFKKFLSSFVSFYLYSFF